MTAAQPPNVVMPGLDPGIHVAAAGEADDQEGVDGRVKPGHDDGV